MSAREPAETAEVAVKAGVKKARRTWDQVLVSSFLAGAYIAFGGMVAITVSSGLNPETWGTLPTLFTGAAFTLGLVLVVVAGSDLATGNMMLVPLGAMRGKISPGDVVRNLTLVLLGNLLGALFVAYFLAVQTGVIGGTGAEGPAALTHARLEQIALDKATAHSAWQTFLRAVGCNWLVCLAVWMSLAATSVSVAHEWTTPRGRNCALKRGNSPTDGKFAASGSSSALRWYRLPKNSSNPCAVGRNSSRSPKWFLPNWPVAYPSALRAVAIVGSSARSPRSMPGIPTLVRPVR